MTKPHSRRLPAQSSIAAIIEPVLVSIWCLFQKDTRKNRLPSRERSDSIQHLANSTFERHPSTPQELTQSSGLESHPHRHNKKRRLRLAAGSLPTIYHQVVTQNEMRAWAVSGE